MKKYIKKIHEDLEDILIHVIIPSAGIGRRMKSYGCKSLLSIKDKRLIDIQLEYINSRFVRTHENLKLYLASISRFVNKNSFEISMDMRSKSYKKDIQ